MNLNELTLARLRGTIGTITVDRDFAIARAEVAEAEVANLRARLDEFQNADAEPAEAK